MEKSHHGTPWRDFWPRRSVSVAGTRKRVVATASRCEGACNRAGEPSVPFCGKGGARERADGFFFAVGKKEAGAKRTLLRRGAGDGGRTHTPRELVPKTSASAIPPLPQASAAAAALVPSIFTRGGVPGAGHLRRFRSLPSIFARGKLPEGEGISFFPMGQNRFPRLDHPPRGRPWRRAVFIVPWERAGCQIPAAPPTGPPAALGRPSTGPPATPPFSRWDR